MTANIAPFLFEGESLVRVVFQKSASWFVLADVCRVLEIANPSNVAARLDDDEKATLHNAEGQAGSGAQAFTIINESGLYSLILTSRKPAAKRFKKWVTAEVLPSIRRTGSYTAPGADPKAVKAHLAERRAKVAELNARTRSIQAVNHALQLVAKAGGPKAIAKNATAMYGELGLKVDMSSAFDQGELNLPDPAAGSGTEG